MRRLSGTKESAGVHVLFVTASETKFHKVIAAVGERSILTVGETVGFAESGGVINLVTHGKNLRHDVSPTAAERLHLKFSLELMKLGTVVGEKSP